MSRNYFLSNKVLLFAASLYISMSFTSCDFLEDASTPGLSDSEIVEGLKEALNVGLGNSVSSASSLDGYLGNELIRILLPEEVVSLQNQIQNSTTLSTAYSTYITLENGGNDLFSELATAMNRGAEEAASKAAPIFGSAITRITFDDARTILEGGNDRAATDFFERETRTDLVSAFSPDVRNALDNTNASLLYGTIVSFLNYDIIPGLTTVGDLLNTDPNLPATLEEYATGKAVDGLFTLVGQEEGKIREDPFVWGSNIIEKVFGSLLN